MRPNILTRNQGFTLVEIVIVFVVLALLVGGVLVGQSMLKAQQLRKVLTDARTYAVAFEQFKQKYGAMPGDMPDATRIWGRADGGTDLSVNCTSPNTAYSVGKTTCNGNGNGILDAPVATVNYEHWRAWQQLSAAELVSGNFTGVGACLPSPYICTSVSRILTIPGTNAPSVDITGLGKTSAGFLFNSIGYNTSGLSNFFYPIVDGMGTNLFLSSYAAAYSPAFPPTGVLTAPDAYLMDLKSDDGMPASGLIVTLKPYGSYAPNCATSTDPAVATYNTLFTDTKTCPLIFMDGFAKDGRGNAQ